MDPNLLHSEIAVLKSQQTEIKRDFDGVRAEVWDLGKREVAVTSDIRGLAASVSQLNKNVEKLAESVSHIDNRMNSRMQELSDKISDVTSSNLRVALAVATALISVTLTLSITVG